MGSGSGKGRGGAGIAASICSILESGVAIAVIVITSIHLWDEQGYQCLLDGKGGVTDSSICSYQWAVGAFSLLASFVVFLLQCITCCCGKVSMLINAIFQGIGCLWWLVAAIIICVYAVPATNNNWPENSYRVAVICLNWGGFVLFAVGMIASVKAIGE
mmetsp:Transcript_10364/g.17785  ORF Transcript_10364/g.17785 Transcript_10364/m.17785 type:complete len:159 (-) Transcript_10364:1592-2068(-)